jgi:hypothetical protein
LGISTGGSPRAPIRDGKLVAARHDDDDHFVKTAS